MLLRIEITKARLQCTGVRCFVLCAGTGHRQRPNISSMRLLCSPERCCVPVRKSGRVRTEHGICTLQCVMQFQAGVSHEGALVDEDRR
ncbi:hypothetical protein B0H67DRAFT_594000 [Lasiosphaeris hirsuta]|uniref:Uncharacterized protein n=1 Tax=Lasiosphaeris hirsuta TaxID=260670 RepID=A0AA40DLP9_9PEZI|nr:hypothetical protein B0H67DRAFT_594000 [Lasiosphaeris hirsuta]